MATETLKVKISADVSNFSNNISKMSKDLGNISKDFEGLKTVGNSMKSVGKAMTLGLTVPIAGIGIASAKTAMDFDAGMNKVSAISGATGGDLSKLTDLAKEMGRTTKFSATESADALSYLGMAGWKTEDMIAGLPAVLNLASAGGTDLALTADIVSDGLTSMGLTAQDTGRFTDIMASTCSNANTSIELMGETLKYIGPVAGSLGIDMESLSSAIGLMGNAGIKGSSAGTALRSGLTNLIKPTKEMQSAMNKYGIEIQKNSDGSVDFMSTVHLLRGKLGQLDETTQASALASIFGKEAMSAWSAVVNASEADFEKLNEAIYNSEGSAKSMSDTMMGGAKGALTEMKSALEGVAITIGERLTPFIEKVADWISDLCQKFQELSPQTQTFIMVVAGLIAVLGPLLMIGGTLVTLFATLSAVAGVLGITFGAICTPVIAVIAGITALIAIGVFLCQNWDTIKAKAGELWNYVCEAWNNMVTSISDFCSQIVDTVSTWITSIGQWFSEGWNSICEFVSQAWTNLCNIVQMGVMFIFEIISMAVQLWLMPWQFIWENFGTVITEKWTEFSTYISEKCNEIVTGITEFFTPIIQWFSDLWNSVKTSTSEAWNAMTTAISSKANEIKTNVTNKFTELKTNSINKFNEIKTGITNKFTEAKNKVSEVANTIKTNISDKFNEAKNKSNEIFNSIKQGIEDKINGARDAVKSGIDKIKSFFDFSWSLPHLKLPHFSISGKFSINPPSTPKFNVDWYSKGGIFKRPTVMGGIGIGDKHRGTGSNAEAVLPINKLPELLGLDKQQNGNVSLNIENFINKSDDDIKDLVEKIAYYMKKKNLSVGVR